MLLTSLTYDVHAAVYGVDDRAQPEALLSAADERHFSATQVLGCQSAGGPFLSGAGNIAGDFTHGVSVAHLFYDRKLHHYHPISECRDLSMFELARRPKFVDQPLSLHPTQIHEGERLLLVAFHWDVRPAYTKRKTHGLVYLSSGGPYYNAAGEVVAMVQGGSRENDEERRPFDPLSDYNVAIRFDPLFLADFEKFLKVR